MATAFDRRAHFRNVVDALSRIMAGESPLILRELARQAIAKGLDVKPGVLFAPEEVLAVEARYWVLAVPSLARWHGDAAAWLSQRQKRDVKPGDGNFAWNILLGGVPIDPEQEKYVDDGMEVLPE